MDPGDLHHGCTRLRQVLVVLAQPTIPPQPSERSFYDPTAPQGDEAPLAGGTTHHPDPVRSLMQRSQRSRAGLWYLLSAWITSRRGKSLPGNCSNNCSAARASSTLAAVTTMASTNPMVSTTI